MLEPYLEDLEGRMDADVEEDLLSQWRSFWEGRLPAGFFAPSRKKTAAPRRAWPKVRVNEALSRPDRMVLQQLAGCSAALAEGTGAILNVRANYGTGILSSLFGAEVFAMADEQDTLPTTKPLAGGEDAVRRILEGGVPDLRAGYGGRCFEMAAHFADRFAPYPQVSRYVRIYHPDTQGPMDVCELLWGSGLFVNLIDQPELLQSLLTLITETYIRFMRAWERLVPPRDGYAPHWGMLHKGRIMIRDDSAMNLSPEMFDEFIKPHDQRLLSEFGGGAVHFCGRGDHYIDRLTRMEGLYAVNLSQPECNDMERIFRHTVDRGIRLIGLQRLAAENALRRGRELGGRVHCW